jgi:hypothetical protein
VTSKHHSFLSSKPGLLVFLIVMGISRVFRRVLGKTKNIGCVPKRFVSGMDREVN